MNDLVKINPTEYGLNDNTAAEIEKAFVPMLSKMTELEEDYNKIVGQEISLETCAEAKTLRLQYVKVRTGTAEIHKKQKAFYLSGGRFVDGWKNAQLHSSQGKEEKLKAIEDHYINIEKQKILELTEKRESEIAQYIDGDFNPPGLGDMPEDVWINYFNGTKAGYEQRIAAEEKAEADRLAIIEADRIEQERIRQENERLKKEAAKKEKALAAERKRAELKLQKEQAETRRIEAEKQAEIDRLQAEKQAEIDKQNKLEAERIEKEKALESASDSEKLKVFYGVLQNINLPAVTTEKGKLVIDKFHSLIDYIEFMMK